MPLLPENGSPVKAHCSMFPIVLYLAWRCGEDVYEIQKVEDGGVVEFFEFLYAIYASHVNNCG